MAVYVRSDTYIKLQFACYMKCCKNEANFAHTGHVLVDLRNCCRDALAFLTPATAERYRSSASVSLSTHLQLSELSLLLSVELSSAAASYRRRVFLVCCTGDTRPCLVRPDSAVHGVGVNCSCADVLRAAGGRIHMSSSSSESLITIAAVASAGCADVALAPPLAGVISSGSSRDPWGRSVAALPPFSSLGGVWRSSAALWLPGSSGSAPSLSLSTMRLFARQVRCNGV
jgi:hypothetical protein